MSERTVIVLHDPVPEDAPPDVADTLVQAEAVAAALARQGWRSRRTPLTDPAEGLPRELRAGPPSLIFNLVESVAGSGRATHLVPLLLETAGLPFTGAGSEAMLLTNHKPLAKELMRASGIPTPDWWLPEDGPPERAGGPWIVKSVWEHASVGIGPDSVVPDAASALEIVAHRRARLGGRWFVERYVGGREFNAALLAGASGPDVLGVPEMVFGEGEGPGIVDYAAKWEPESASYARSTATFEPRSPDDGGLTDILAAIGRACWRRFGLAGYGRVDFRVDAQGRPWVLEVNTNPCLAPDAGYALAGLHRGMGYEAIVSRIAAEGALRERA